MLLRGVREFARRGLIYPADQFEKFGSFVFKVTIDMLGEFGIAQTWKVIGTH